VASKEKRREAIMTYSYYKAAMIKTDE